MIYLGNSLLFPYTQNTKEPIKILCDFLYQVLLQVNKGPSSSQGTGRTNIVNSRKKKKKDYPICCNVFKKQKTNKQKPLRAEVLYCPVCHIKNN